MKCLTESPIEVNTERLILHDRIQWNKLKTNMPFFQLRSDLEISITPSDNNAAVRFLIRKRGHAVEWSVYLDVASKLGVRQSVYWELYPDSHGENSRYGLDEIDQLMMELCLSVNKKYPPDD